MSTVRFPCQDCQKTFSFEEFRTLNFISGGPWTSGAKSPVHGYSISIQGGTTIRACAACGGYVSEHTIFSSVFTKKESSP